MNPIYTAFCLLLALSTYVAALEQQDKVEQEIKYITESLDDLIGQLNLIKQEATGRLSKFKGLTSDTVTANDQERIRQTKVSRFILKRVAELEQESLKMKDDLIQLQRIQMKHSLKPSLRVRRSAEPKQEDLDFDEQQQQQPPTTTSQGMPSQTDPSSSTTTMKPDEEAAKIGFDIEALKKLGEEIGKRLDQFGKDAAKNLGDLIEGVKLVFREPNQQSGDKTKPSGNSTTNDTKKRGSRKIIISA